MLSDSGLLTHNYGTEIFHFVKVQTLFTVFTVLNYSFYPAIYVKVINLLHSEIVSTKTRYMYSLYGKYHLNSFFEIQRKMRLFIFMYLNG